MGTNTPHICIPGLVWQKQARRFSQFEFKVGKLRFPIHFVCVSAALYHRGYAVAIFPLQSMRTVGKMCLDLAIGVLRALFEKAPVRQGRFGAKFAKRQLFFDTQIFLFRIQKVIFGIHTAVRQGFNVGFCQSKCSVVFSFGVFSSTFQVGPIDHCQRPVKHTNCLPVTFTRAKLVRPWKSPCRKSMGLVSSQCKELFWYKP